MTGSASLPIRGRRARRPPPFPRQIPARVKEDAGGRSLAVQQGVSRQNPGRAGRPAISGPARGTPPGTARLSGWRDPRPRRPRWTDCSICAWIGQDGRVAGGGRSRPAHTTWRRCRMSKQGRSLPPASKLEEAKSGSYRRRTFRVNLANSLTALRIMLAPISVLFLFWDVPHQDADRRGFLHLGRPHRRPRRLGGPRAQTDDPVRQVLRPVRGQGPRLHPP